MTEYKTVDTTTLAGLREAEHLHETGWKIVRVGPFTTQFCKTEFSERQKAKLQSK